MISVSPMPRVQPASITRRRFPIKSLRKLTPLFRLFYAALVLAFGLVLLFKGASGPSSAQQSQPQERQVENTIPKHVPLDVKLTTEKEKNWKDLKNENWAKDFELEITNTGDKPIYALGLRLYFDVQNESGYDLTTDISYGRPEVSDGRTRATADDVPINPGESKRFTIQPESVRAWDYGRRKKGYRLPTKVRIRFMDLRFGDGTGFEFDGVPYPRRSPEASKLDNVTSPPRDRRRPEVKWRSVTS